MKSQLLEDIDDSQSEPAAPAFRRVQPVKPPPSVEPRPRPEVWSRRAAPVDVEARPGKRAGVWRSRDASAPPEPIIHRAAAPEAPPVAPPPPPEIASFASRAPDWVIPLTHKPVPWTERWGRKALGWSSAVVLALVVGGAGTWMLRETQVESTLAVVAGNAPATLAAAPAPAPAIVAEPEALPVPPLRLLPPESVATTAAAPPAEPLADTINPLPAAPVAAVRAADPDQPPAAAPAPRPAQRPVSKRATERRLAAAAPAKRPRETQEQPRAGRQRERERIVAKASAPAPRAAARPPARPVPRPAPVEPPQQPAASPLAETLRMCRAAGYHATACIKRGCEATRFGLACRG